MSKVLDQLIYVNGALDDTVQSFNPSPEHDKNPIDTITPDGIARHVDQGNKRYPFTMTVVPLEGRDNARWDLLVDKDVAVSLADNDTIMVENIGDGKREIYQNCFFTKVDKPVGKGSNTWTVTGFALRLTPLQA